jgi:hypothetical protein
MRTAVVAALIALPALAGVTRERRPEIFLEYGSRDASVTKVTFVVDGVDVTAKAKITGTRASFTPAEDLAIGAHTVEVTVSDDKGRTRTKRWTFTVDPNAKDVDPPGLEFVAPTPANGEVRLPTRTTVALRASDALDGVDPSSVKLWVARDGGDLRELALSQSGDVWQADLGELGSGTYVVRAAAADKAGNRAPLLWRGFAVDGEAPKVARVSVAPTPVTLPGPATILVEVEDKPFGEVKEVAVEVAGRTLKGSAVRRLAAIPWDLKDGQGRYVDAGTHAVKVSVVDYAGQRGEGTGAVVVRGEAPEEGAVPLRLDPPKPETASSPIAITGNTRPAAQVELFVNGRPAGTVIAGGSGGFAFGAVALDAGLNRIEAVARDLIRGESSAMVTVSTTYRAPAAEPPRPEPPRRP